MDALSQILDDIHMSHAEYLYVNGVDNWHFSLDAQGHFVFHIILFGHANFQIDQEAPVSLQGGDILMVPTGKQHHLYSASDNVNSVTAFDLLPAFNGHRNDAINLGGTGKANCLVLTLRCVLDVEMARPLLSALPHMITFKNAIGIGAPQWLQIGLQFLALEAERNRPGRHTLVNRLVGMLLILCVRDYIEKIPDGSETWLTALRDPQLAPVLSAIHAEPDKSWTVADLANLALMSRSAFAERFNDKMGQTPLAYLSAHRLRLAAWNLRENNQSISRISEHVGYASETAFSQAFKRQYGLSPSLYRKQHQQQ